MKQQSLTIFIFSILFTIFFLLLIFFRIPFPLYPLMSYQDVFDLLTPLILIPFYWILFEHTSRRESDRVERIAFMVLSSVWVLGHGMHLAANSINNLAEGLAKNQIIDIIGTDIYKLTYFLDEHLSHYLWHIGIVGLASLLIYRDLRRPADNKKIGWTIILSGLIYGFTLFCVFLEGQTVPLGFPFIIIITLLMLVLGRKKLAQRPISTFFFVACLIAAVLFTFWALYWGGFPQFSDVGLI